LSLWAEWGGGPRRMEHGAHSLRILLASRQVDGYYLERMASTEIETCTSVGLGRVGVLFFVLEVQLRRTGLIVSSRHLG